MLKQVNGYITIYPIILSPQTHLEKEKEKEKDLNSLLHAVSSSCLSAAPPSPPLSAAQCPLAAASLRFGAAGSVLILVFYLFYC